MDISKTSSTYLKYRAGCTSYADFFEECSSYRDRNVGFCSMMRTIYFWRPLIATLRFLLIGATFLVFEVAWYHFSTEILVGVVDIALFVLVIWLVKLTATSLGIKSYFEIEEMPLVFQWAKAAHDRICPLVNFTEEVACEE